MSGFLRMRYDEHRVVHLGGLTPPARRCLGWGVVFYAILGANCAAAEPTIQIEHAATPPATTKFVLSGLPAAQLAESRNHSDDDAAWEKLLAVYVFSDGKPSSTAMLGSYSVRGDVIVFEPKYPLRPGV